MILEPITISSIFSIGSKLIDKLIPDPEAKAKAQVELFKMQQEGEFKALEADIQIALSQTKINEIEAASSDFFRGGWRPGAGWVCTIGLFYSFLLHPMLSWLAQSKGWPVPPTINMDVLMGLLTGLLGLGGFRTYERIKGKV